MQKNVSPRAVVPAPKFRTHKKRRKFRDPRLRWMDKLLRSLQRPAPESWIPAPYVELLESNSRRRGSERRRFS